jgi:hypothetical protein
MSVNNIVEFLTEVLTDQHRSQADRDRASTALKFYSEKIAEEIKPSGSAKRDEVGRHVAKVFARMGAEMLWTNPDDCMLQTRTDADGIVRKAVMSRTYHDPSYKYYGNPYRKETPAAAPAPVPEFTPASPLPVLPPSDAEKQAVDNLSFDERFSPSAVAARVAAIEKEAAQMRASREQTG